MTMHMKRRHMRHTQWSIITSLIVLSFFFFATQAFAAESKIFGGTVGDSSMTVGDYIRGGSGLGETDPTELASFIIIVVLDLLALLAVILIIYAGFTWMTAAGNDDQVEKAQDTLKAAVIGLIIILAAWALTVYIIGKVEDSTTFRMIDSPTIRELNA
jgi:hypothetical protein